MKKSFLVALMAVVCSLSACANDQLIPYAQLPEAAKATVQQYFDPGTVAYARWIVRSSATSIRFVSTTARSLSSRATAVCTRLIVSTVQCRKDWFRRWYVSRFWLLSRKL